MNVRELAERRGGVLRKAAATKGGEWVGECPGCGGTDRFHVWPEQQEGRGSYWCRGCGKAGDAIQFLRDFDGLGYREACERLGVEARSRGHELGTPRARREERGFEPRPPADPDERWQEHARKFVLECYDALAGNEQALAYLERRGIPRAAASRYGLGWNAGDGKGRGLFKDREAWGLASIFRNRGVRRPLWLPVGLVIPCWRGGRLVRIRIRQPDGADVGPRYYAVPGSSMDSMVLNDGARVFVVVEAELDGIAIECGLRNAEFGMRGRVGAVALGSSAVKPDARTAALLRGAMEVLVALDCDGAGKKALEWWRREFPDCRPWLPPKGKDPGEAFAQGVDLAEWVRAGLPPAMGG